MRLPVLGLDIGGANLKAGHSQGYAWSRPFALWRQPQDLRHQLGLLISQAPPFDILAVTMTGELCDCYLTKREGVHLILHAVAGKMEPVLVWRNDGILVPIAEVRKAPLKVAAANWLALAAFAGRYCPRGTALLIDIGSTTTDLVPLFDGIPVPQGRTDLERLVAHELVYLGLTRTPVCALLKSVTWRGRSFRPAAEWFATTHDAYLLLGDLPEDQTDFDTPDRRPATRHFAHARLARMLCADAETFSYEDALALGEFVRQTHLNILQEELAHVAARWREPPRTIILSGIGGFLARRAIAKLQWPSQIISLTQELGSEIARAACAYALAALVSERS
jgi:probable H4MPT-linked C1 transfer pathway protein